MTRESNNKDKELSHLIGVHTDVAEDEQMEETLPLSAQQWRATFDAMNDGVCMLDVEGRILRCNKAMKDFMGKPFSEIVGHFCWEIVHGASGPLDECPLMRSRETRRRETTVLEVGSRWFAVAADPILSEAGGIVGIVHIMSDITERKRTEDALRESEERLRLLLEHSLDGISICERNLPDYKRSKLIFCNERFVEMTGQTREELMACEDLNKLIISHTPKEEKDAAREPFAQGLPMRGISSWKRPDGKENYHEWVSAPLKIKDKVYSLSISRDITEGRQMERQIQTALHDKEVLLREIHHRIKNNLQMISSLLDLQSEVIGDRQAREALAESQRRIRSIAFVHEQLYQSKDLAWIDMALYIQDLTTYLQDSYGACAISLRIDVADVILDVETAVPCGLIVNELVSNALKYAFPDIGVGKVRVVLRPRDDKFELIVSDNGIGLPNDLDIQNPKSLGLKLVSFLTRQLNGAIELDRSEGTALKIAFAAPKDGRQNNAKSKDTGR